MKRGDTGYSWHDAAYWGVMALACAAFLVMNVFTTLKEDDLAYALVEGAWTPIGSLADVLRSHAVHFANSNGRIADLLAVLFDGLLGKTAFNVLNTLVFALMAHLLALLSTRRRSIMALALFLAVVGTCFPVPGETMLWVAGSCNYLWAITASLAVVYWLLRRRGRSLGWTEGVLLLLASWVAGAFNEATSFGFLAGLILYYVLNSHQRDSRVAVALLGYALGVALIVASPGAWQRAADGGIAVDMGLADLVSSRCHIFVEKAWRFYLPLAAAVLLAALLVARRGRSVTRSVWPCVFLCMALVMFALGINHERAYAPWVTVALIIVTMAADAVLARRRWARLGLTVTTLAMAVFTFGRGIKVLREYKAFDDGMVREIVAAPEHAVLRERQFDGYSRFVKPMNYVSSHFFAHEVIYRAYYGKKNVQFVSDSVFVRYHEGRLLDGGEPYAATTDRPDLVGPVYAFADQDYVAILIKTPYIPCSFQTARYYRFSLCGESSDPDEMAHRRHYGIPTEWDPHGFYPIVYQGQCYLIADPSDGFDSQSVFPLTLPPDPEEVTITLP